VGQRGRSACAGRSHFLSGVAGPSPDATAPSKPEAPAGRKVNTHMQAPIVFTATADYPNSKS
jgi:hypothetical protein